MADDWNQGVVPPGYIPQPPAEAFIPSVPIPEPTVNEAEVVEEKPKVEHKYRAVRGGGDQIFIIVGTRKHWVLNPQVYAQMGYKFGDEEKVEQSELATYLPGETITPENVSKFL